MAKAKAHLHVEIDNDDDWDRLMMREGIIVIDIYSEWCGYCTGMSANLRKIKLEVGGDMMHIALAKSDNITVLERFRNRSEPTWMYVSQGKMTNLLFGCNAPEIIKVTLDEIKKEKDAMQKNEERAEGMPVTEMHPNEILRFEEAMKAAQRAKELEEEKRLKDTRDRKEAECQNIISNVYMGALLVFPCAKDRYHEILSDGLKEAGAVIATYEKVNMTVEMLEEMFYFYEEEEPPFDDPSVNSLLNGQSVVVGIKTQQHGLIIPDFDEFMRKILYGPDLEPPGAERCPYRKALAEVENEETGEIHVLTGMWVPKVACIRATMLRMFFHKNTAVFEIPDPGPTPPHFVLAYPPSKIKEALSVMSKYPKMCLHYGFFTSADPEDTELVAKSVQRLENPDMVDKRTFQETLIFAVDKKRSQCLLELVRLRPIYMSPNTDQGAIDSKLFFSDDYAESLPDDEKVYIEPEEEEKEEEETKKEEANRKSGESAVTGKSDDE